MEAGSQIWSSMLGTQGGADAAVHVQRLSANQLFLVLGRDQLNVLFSLQLNSHHIMKDNLLCSKFINLNVNLSQKQPYRSI